MVRRNLLWWTHGGCEDQDDRQDHKSGHYYRRDGAKEMEGGWTGGSAEMAGAHPGERPQGISPGLRVRRCWQKMDCFRARRGGFLL